MGKEGKMSGKTNFLNLKKPDSLDYYNIQDFNDNSDIIDKKTQELANNADEDRKRVDNLLHNNTIDTVEIGKTIIEDSGESDNDLTLENGNDAWYYSLFGGAKNVDSNFCTITETTENQEKEYTVKLLNPGLYYMTFTVHAEMDGVCSEQVTALLRLHKSNTSDWSTYDVLDIENVEILKTENTSTYTKIHFLFRVAEPSYIRMYIAVYSNTKQITFRINDCKIIVLDWEGKKSGAASETADIRLGVDGQIYKTAGEAVRKQFEMILKNCSGLQEFSRDTSGQISEHILGDTNLVKLSKIESKDGFKVYQSETERNKILIVNETATGENIWEIADCTVYKSEENSSEERLFAGGTYNIFGVNSDTTIKFYDESGEVIGNEVNCNYTIQKFTIPSNCVRLKIYVNLINPETFLSIFVYKSRKMIQEQLNDIYAKIDEMQAVDAELVTLKEKINKKIQAWFPGKTVENSTLTTKNSVLTGPTDDTILDLAGNEIGTTVEVVSPAPPYYLGDLWVSDDAVYICTTARTEGDFRSFDWMKILERK